MMNSPCYLFIFLFRADNPDWVALNRKRISKVTIHLKQNKFNSSFAVFETYFLAKSENAARDKNIWLHVWPNSPPLLSCCEATAILNIEVWYRTPQGFYIDTYATFCPKTTLAPGKKETPSDLNKLQIQLKIKTHFKNQQN